MPGGGAKGTYISEIIYKISCSYNIDPVLNPIPSTGQVIGTPKKAKKKTPEKKVAGGAKKPSEEDKKQPRKKTKNQLKQKKKKERMDGLYIPKESGGSKEGGNRSSPLKNEGEY